MDDLTKLVERIPHDVDSTHMIHFKAGCLRCAFDAALAARPVRAVLTEALDALYRDNHRWSTRPCSTCSAISEATGVAFGCDKMANREPHAALDRQHAELPAPTVRVAGTMERSISDHIRGLEVCIEEEQKKPLPDNALVAKLCDAVRLAREYASNAEPSEDAAVEEAKRRLLGAIQDLGEYCQPALCEQFYADIRLACGAKP